MSFMKGQTLNLKSKVETVTVNWKQDSFLGFGGDKSQNYILCDYTTSEGQSIPVYIQGGYVDIPQSLNIDSSLQYGMQEGVLFFVLHDKSQKPYQHRFKSTALEKFAYFVNDILKMAKGVDLSWVAGDYLHDV